MNRNSILRISTIAALGVALMTNATVGQSSKSDKERLIGTWTLVSITSGEGANQTLSGDWPGPNPKGTMMVDANGRFSIMAVRSDLPKFGSNNRMSGTPEENQTIVKRGASPFGTMCSRSISRDADALSLVRRQRGDGSANLTYRRAK